MVSVFQYIMKPLLLVSILLSVVVIGSSGFAYAISDEDRIEKLQAGIDKLLDRASALEDKKAYLYDRIDDLDDRIDKLEAKANKKQSLLYSINGTPDTIPVKIIGMSMGSGCKYNNTCYLPADIMINIGDTVEWSNRYDNTLHTVTSGNHDGGGYDLLFDSMYISTHDTFAFTFYDIGYYDYFCTLHPWMTGSVTVVGQ